MVEILPGSSAPVSLWRRALSVACRLAVFGGAIALLVHGVGWGDLRDSVRGISPALLIVVVALNAGMMGLKALRLRWLLLPKSASVIACFLTLLTSSAINNVVPFRGGDIARLWILERRTGVAKATGVAVTVIERLIDIAALALFAIPASFYASSQRWATPAASVVLVAVVGLLIGLRFVVNTRLKGGRPATSSVPGRSYVRAKLAQVVERVAVGMTSLTNETVLGRTIGVSIVIWCVETMMVMTCSRALNMVIPSSLAVITLLGINLALALPSTPANWGPFEAGVVVVLTAGGFAKPQALAFGFIYHIVQVVPVTIGGLAVVAFGGVGVSLRGRMSVNRPNEQKAIGLEILTLKEESRGAERT